LNDIGNNIRIVREIRGFSQEYVASNLGVSQRALSKIERGESDVTFKRLGQLCVLFEIRLEDLLFLNIFAIDQLNIKQVSLPLHEDNILNVYQEQIQHLKSEIHFLREKLTHLLASDIDKT
jgi:transcriptional regulator with XRE-family HTH domain